MPAGAIDKGSPEADPFQKPESEAERRLWYGGRGSFMYGCSRDIPDDFSELEKWFPG